MKVSVIGGGAFGTAVACVLARTLEQVSIFVRDAAQAESINLRRNNSRYLPGFKLPKRVRACMELDSVSEANVVFLATPAHSIERIALAIKDLLNPDTIVVNLAKGLSPEFFTLDRLLQDRLPENTIASLKGPNFARPLLQGAPSGMTLAIKAENRRAEVTKCFAKSSVTLDHWYDTASLEFVGALKNVMAIIMGICDATEDNPNTRYMVVQLLIREAKEILEMFGFDQNVLYTFGGIGDLLMTSLNDASRNRTLGLLIGRGFSFDGDGPVLEGRRTLSLINRRLQESKAGQQMLAALEEVLDKKMTPQMYFKLLTQDKNSQRNIA